MNDIAHRLMEKAEESLAVAKELLAQEHFGFAASRAYYAMFYIAESLLVEQGVRCKSHQQLISQFGQTFARTSVLDAKFHRWLIDAQDLRMTGDYGVEKTVGEIEAQQVCAWAAEFLGTVNAWRNSRGTATAGQP